MSEQILSIETIELSVLHARVECDLRGVDYSRAVCPYPNESVAAMQWHLQSERDTQFALKLFGKPSTWATMPRVFDLAAMNCGDSA